MSFDLKAYVQKKKEESFSLSDYVAQKKQQALDNVKPEDPTLGQIGTGIVKELAIGEGAKYAGTTLGSIVPVVGTTAGYLIGGTIGGIAGSIVAQREEGREDISWGRVTADTLLNLMPFGTGKIGKGAKVVKQASKSTDKVFPKLLEKATDIGKAQAARAATGAGISVGAQQVEKGIEEQRFLTPKELLVAGGTGAALNIGIGALADGLGDIYRKKFAGKTDAEVNANYKKGDPDTVTFVDQTTGGDPKGKFSRLLDVINSYAIPTKIIGPKTSKLIRQYRQQGQAAMDFAGRARKQINNLTKNYTEDQKKRLDSYMSGETKELGEDLLESKTIIDSVRKEIGEYQKTLVELYEKGVLDMNEVTFNKIKKSISDGNYLRKEYQMFVDPKYKPTLQQQNALKNRLIVELQESARKNLKEQGKSNKQIEDTVNSSFQEYSQEAERKIRGLLDARDDPDALSNLFKRRELQSKEMDDFLGIITDPGERLFGTVSRLGRDVTKQKGLFELGNMLVKNGVAKVISSGEQIPSGYVPLKVGRKLQNKYGRQRADVPLEKPQYQDIMTGTRYKDEASAFKDGVPMSRISKVTKESKIVNEGEQVYVPKEVDTAINNLNQSGKLDESNVWTEGFITKLVSTTTGLSKFVKVPLSIAAYPVQFFGNAFMVSSMGMNPFKNYGKNLMVAVSDLNSKNFREGKFFGFDTKLTLSQMKRLKELDLIDRGVTASDIREGLNKGFLSKVTRAVTEPFGKLYSIFDTAQRLAVFDSYKEIIKKGLSPEDFAKLPKDKLEEMAAELTNSTYQNYGRINPAMRYLSRIGVLQEFAAFNLEQLRTLYNQASFIRSLKNGKFSKDIKDEFGVEFDQKFANELGNKRLIAATAGLTAATAGLTMYNRNNGIDEETEIALRRTATPSYNENAKLLFSMDGDKLKITNASYQMPVAELTSVFEAGLRGEGFVDSVGSSFSALYDKFIGEGTMNFNNFFAAINNFDPNTGNKISTEPKELDRFKEQAKYYALETFTPTGLGNLKDKTKLDIAGRFLLGLRTQNTTISDGFGFKMRDLKDNLGVIRTSYASDLKSDKNMVQSYKANNEVYKRNLAQIIVHVEDLRTLGKSEEEIDALLKKNKVSEDIRKASLAGKVLDMPLAVGISGTKEERRKNLTDLYDSFPPEIGKLMLTEAKTSDKISQKTLDSVLRLSKMKKLYPKAYK